jgi:hypothetical protein
MTGLNDGKCDRRARDMAVSLSLDMPNTEGANTRKCPTVFA